MVYGQLRRNFSRNRNHVSCQPDFDHYILRPVGKQLWQFDLRDDIGNSQSSAGSPDIGVGKSDNDLFGSQQHIDGDRRVWY